MVIKAIAGLWEALNGGDAPRQRFSAIGNASGLTESFGTRENTTRDLFKPYGTARPYTVPPPNYEDSIQDLPPDYTTTDGLATVQLSENPFLPNKSSVSNDQKSDFDSDLYPVSDVKVDLSGITDIRQCANKKAKKAAKQAQQAKWADSGDEGNEGGGDGADGGDNGGGDGGSGAGGAGGDPPGGGGDGNDDDW